jgi:mono/diheme cytochrome c family protein
MQGWRARTTIAMVLLIALVATGCGSTRTVTRTHTVTTTTAAMTPAPAAVWVDPSTAVEMPAVQRPLIFGFSADGSGYARVQSWSSWTGSEATSSAVMELNECNPSCAQGSFTSYPGLLVLSDPQPCPENRLTEFMIVTFIPDRGDAYPRDALTADQRLSCVNRPAKRAGTPNLVAVKPPSDLTASQKASFVAGEGVAEQSGCEACHLIAGNGNNGPGPPLTHIGSTRSAAAISAALRNPTAPMPSFSQLAKTSPKKFRDLVDFLALLK